MQYLDESSHALTDGGAIARAPKKKGYAKTRKMKVGLPPKKEKSNKNTELSPNMVLQRTASYPRNDSTFMDIENDYEAYYEIIQEMNANPADLLSGTPQTIYDRKKPSEITIYIAGHGEEIFPRKGHQTKFPEDILKLTKSKQMRVRIINKVNAPLVEGLAMIGPHSNKMLKTEDKFYGMALEHFSKNPKTDSKKILKKLGKEYIDYYKHYLDAMAKHTVKDDLVPLVKLKKEILNKSNYLDIYHPTHEKNFYIRPAHHIDNKEDDDSTILRYGIYIVDVRNSPHGNAFSSGLNLTPMTEEYENNKSMYLDLSSYLKLMFCSGDSPSELANRAALLCKTIDFLINPSNKLIMVKLSEILPMLYYLGFSQINIIDSTCRVDCGSNTGVCSFYKVDNISLCDYNMKKSLLEIAKLKKDLSISPYTAETSKGSWESNKKIIKKTKTRRAVTANLEKKFTQRLGR